MSPQSLKRLVNLSLVVGGVLLWNSAAQATGRWKLPATIPQYFGYGNGPGYHAPRVRMVGHYPAKVARRINMPNQGQTGACDQRELAQSPIDRYPETLPGPTGIPSTSATPESAQQTHLPRQEPPLPMVQVLGPQSPAIDSAEHSLLLNQRSISSPCETTRSIAMESPTMEHDRYATRPKTVELLPIQELGDSWLAPVRLPVVNDTAPTAIEHVAEPESLLLLPPVLTPQEAQNAGWSEQSDETGTYPHDIIPRDSLFNAPPPPGY